MEEETSKLLSATLRLLQNRPYSKTLKAISEETGVPEGWIKSLSNNRIKEPSCIRIEKLYCYLSGRSLDDL